MKSLEKKLENILETAGKIYNNLFCLLQNKSSIGEQVKTIKIEDVELRIDHYQSLNVLRDIFYNAAIEKGWHSEKEINLGNYLCNLHCEISELFEAYRSDTLDKPCDKSEKMLEICGETLTCAEEEMGDLLIRILDSSAALNIDIARAVKIKHMYNQTRSYRHGGKKA